MPAKRKAPAKAAQEPASKEAKTEAPKKTEEPKTAAPKKAEEPKKAEAPKEAEEPKTVEEAEAAAATAEPDTSEKETDAVADKRPALKAPIVFKTCDTTLNVVPTMGGRVLRSLTEGGMQFLIAGARARTGLKAGRYMFEAKVLESIPVNEQVWQRNAPRAKQLLRVGFSTAESSLVLGETEGSICFDTDGTLFADGKKSFTQKRVSKDTTIGVLLNLDPKSPNANTFSIFRNGVRLTQPSPLPETLQGKTLFPHVAFRNVSVQVNFGPEPMAPLPFSCRMAGAAAQADTETLPSPEPKDGKYEVLFPVGYPDEGTFEWLDGFLAKNPHYTELSDRKIIEWAMASGVWRNKQWGGKESSNDKPRYDFGLQPMDDFSVRGVLEAVTPVFPRHYVVMEVRGNLLPNEREKVLKRFSASCFKRTARVVMGEPPEEFKVSQHERLRKAKQQKADQAWKAKKAEKERKKQAAERAKKLAEQRKEAQEKRQKVIEEAKKKRAEAEAKKKAEAEAKKQAEGGEAGEKAAEGEAKADEGGEKKAEEPKAEEPKAEEAKAEAEEPKKMEVDEGAKGEGEEKKEEEKKEEAAPEEDDDMGDEPPQVDLDDEEKKRWFSPKPSVDVAEGAFATCFSAFSLPEKSEGFDSIVFEWQEEGAAKSYLREKVLEKKKTSRVENLKPGQWFQDKLASFKKVFAEWQKKQETFVNSPEQKAKVAAKAAKKDDEEEEDTAMVGDIFSIEDVCDVGEGEPLFKDFKVADWATLYLRFELWLLQAAFKKDVNDPDRPSVPLAHFAFYYQRYYKRALNPKLFGAEDIVELVKMVRDSVAWEEELLTTPLLIGEDEDPSHFVKHTEEARRERQRRIDAGDETARPKVQQAALTAFLAPPRGAMKPGSAVPARSAPKPTLAKPLTPGVPKPTPLSARPALAAVKPGAATVTPPSAAKGGSKGSGWGQSGWGSGGSWKGGGKGGKGKW